MSHVIIDPIKIDGYCIFPVEQAQCFPPDVRDHMFASRGEYDKYFWINPTTLKLEFFTTLRDARKATRLARGGRA